MKYKHIQVIVIKGDISIGEKAIGCSMGVRNEHLTLYSAHANGDINFFYTVNQNTVGSDSFELGIDICKQGRSGPGCGLNCPRSFFIGRCQSPSRYRELPNRELRVQQCWDLHWGSLYLHKQSARLRLRDCGLPQQLLERRDFGPCPQVRV